MKNHQEQNSAIKLRQRAEKILKKKLTNTNLQLSQEEMQKLIYELEVHQIELELQNEELKMAQAASKNYAEKYHELYDFAPIGYLSLSKDGAIQEINLWASKMLGKDRSHLKNSLLGFYISDDTKPIFNHFLWKIFTGNTNENCEVIIPIDASSHIDVRLTGTIGSSQEQCLVTLLDITNQKRAEEELKKWATLFQPKSN